MPIIEQIISGGQTGADTAALNAAISLGIAHGGWCPRGRKREDGIIPSRFRLTETPSGGYLQRTLWNVRDSDGTVIFSLGPRLVGGSKATARVARRKGKPCLRLVASQTHVDHVAALLNFIGTHRIRVLNIAGPRKSQERGVGRFVAKVLRATLGSARPVSLRTRKQRE